MNPEDSFAISLLDEECSENLIASQMAIKNIEVGVRQFQGVFIHISRYHAL